MNDVSRRELVSVGAALAGVAAGLGAGRAQAKSQSDGFIAATTGGPGRQGPVIPGLQGVFALCEVTGGGEKVYGIAVEYDKNIDPRSITLETYAAGVFPAARGYFPGLPQSIRKDVTDEVAKPRPIIAAYTNGEAALRADCKSVAGRYVILAFAQSPDLSLPTTDSDKVIVTQNRAVRTVYGANYPASIKAVTNVGQHSNRVVIRGVDAWEQNHWWWDDAHATWQEYSIFLPRSFLEPGGETKAYPLVLAVTHSGTSYAGTCLETLTEQCIASIWSMPENQADHECVVITPRYERTTMNDYWEHTSDVENTYRLVESLLADTWNYGNPNLPDRANKVLRIDPKRVYCTGWSMGAMTTLWLMARHSDTFAGGLVIAGQQRPQDVVTLAGQKLLIITGSEDNKATPWNEKCVPVWRQAGGKVTRPVEQLDPNSIFPVEDQGELTRKIDSYLSQNGNITFITFAGVDHMASARKFFYIKAARDWLFGQVKT